MLLQEKKTPYQDKKKVSNFSKKKISSPIFFVINFNLAIRFEKKRVQPQNTKDKK